MIGIVSYYPSDPQIRYIRKKNHLQQLKQLMQVFPSETIYIVDQNYKEKDYVNKRETNDKATATVLH